MLPALVPGEGRIRAVLSTWSRWRKKDPRAYSMEACLSPVRCPSKGITGSQILNSVRYGREQKGKLGVGLEGADIV